MRCDSCGFDNPPTAKFCQECGNRLSDAAHEPASTLHGERRQLTVLFSDLIGSTELSVRLDPEEWREVVVQYHRAASEAIAQAGGRVAQYQGDGIIAFFGYPEASEDAAIRGVRAGLALIAAMERVNQLLEARNLKLAVRVGIHTGLVMVGAGVDLSTWVFGETPNVASRVQTAALPNTVYISSATQQLVGAAFVLEDCGEHALKGVSRPMQLFRAVRSMPSRVKASSAQAQALFVGRERELDLLRECWCKSAAGRGCMVLVQGEAGIGKTRLLQQFKHLIADAMPLWIESSATSYEENTPFAPVIELLRQAFGWSTDTPAEARVRMLEQSFQAAGLDPASDVPLIAPLFDLALPEGYIAPLMPPDQQRRKLIASMLAWALGSARIQPLVIVIEDLQWADPSTLELLGQLAEQCAQTSILLLLTSRMEFAPAWQAQAHHLKVRLQRLDRAEVQRMITALVSHMLPMHLSLEDLAARTDGVPLFVEEVTRAIVMSGQLSSASQQVPSSLQDLLMARLDRLGPAKEIAQMGAVLGREFSLPLLRAIAGLSDDDLNKAMSRLVQAEIVQPLDLQAGFAFRQMLFRDAAYDSLLKGRRRELHLAAAKAIEEQFQSLAAQRPELLAQHYTEGGDMEKAVDAWEAAGARNVASAAIAEAVQNYSRAIQVLYTLPDTPMRAKRELPLQLSLGQSVQAVRGFGSPEMANAFGRARQVIQQLGDDPSSFFIMLGIWSSLNSRSEIVAAHEMSLELARVAQVSGQPAMQVWANLTRALSMFMRGDFAGTSHHLQILFDNYREEDHLWYPFDPKVTGYIHHSLTLWHLGRVEEALRCQREQLELGRRLSPGNEALAHLTSCSMQVYLDDPELLLDHATQMIEIGQKNSLEPFLMWGAIYATYARHRLGQAGEISGMREAIAKYLASGTRSSLGLYLSMLARMYQSEGLIPDALSTVDDGLSAAEEERVHWPELLRIQGDLFVMRGDMQDAEQAYQKSIGVAGQQGAVMQQLRASIRLAALLHGWGRGEEGLHALATFVGAVPDAGNTKDMHEARKLLALR